MSTPESAGKDAGANGPDWEAIENALDDALYDEGLRDGADRARSVRVVTETLRSIHQFDWDRRDVAADAIRDAVDEWVNEPMPSDGLGFTRASVADFFFRFADRYAPLREVRNGPAIAVPRGDGCSLGSGCVSLTTEKCAACANWTTPIPPGMGNR